MLEAFARRAAVLAVFAVLMPVDAEACGGLFCSRQPVEQTAERILFEVGADTVTMTTQISFSGDAADFAWVLPLAEVPLAGSLAVFPQALLEQLDRTTSPMFLPPDTSCIFNLFSCGGCNAEPTFVDGDAREPSVTVHVRQQVGDYDVAVIESADPAALIRWLRDQGYRITAGMEPYVRRYTNEGLKFLALKLISDAGVDSIVPFRFTLPGTTPTIPLRMTAVAAEPEMAIVVFVLASQRFEGKNWANIEIPNEQLRYDPQSPSGTLKNNWPKLVAQGVDEAGGQGWVTEFAGATAPLAKMVRAQVPPGLSLDILPDIEQQWLELLAPHDYLTRLFTRLSAEEMTSDPVFGRTTLGDVARERQLSRVVSGIDHCRYRPYPPNPCAFATCGASGLCLPATLSTPTDYGPSEVTLQGCACVPGATARPTFSPDGEPTVICQDGRMSFLNPGDRETDAVEVLPDACAGFSCGEHGQCVAMNLRPTCVCDQGFVAISQTDDSGARSMECVEPRIPVPAGFYDRRLPALPDDLPGGREVRVPAVLPFIAAASAPVDFPLPRSLTPTDDSADSTLPAVASSVGGGGCHLAPGARGAGCGGGLLALLGGAFALALARRRARGRTAAFGFERRATPSATPSSKSSSNAARMFGGRTTSCDALPSERAGTWPQQAPLDDLLEEPGVRGVSLRTEQVARALLKP